MNERTQRLRNRFLASPREIDVERARIITASYKKNSDMPVAVQRALGTMDILSMMSICIREDELIVGNQGLRPRSVPLFPEYANDWILTQMETFPTREGDQFAISEEQKKTLRELLPYWRGKSLRDRILAEAPEDIRRDLGSGVFANENYTMSGPGHMNPDYAYLLENGMAGVKRRCEEKLVELERAGGGEFYRSCLITADAVVTFAQRYAAEASRMAEKQRDPGRRRELLEMAEVCEKVPAGPAETFHEALQFVYFCQLVMQLEANGLAICPGRLDQLLIGYYTRDTERGLLDKGRALELIECFYLKLNEIDKVYSNEATRSLQGPAHGQTVTLGGVDEDGRDAANELTFLFLDADYDIRLVQPDIALRIHATTPDPVLLAAARNIRAGLNKVKVFNDEVIIQSLLSLGIPLGDARDFCLLGCSEPVISGKTNSWGNAGHLNLAKCLELALNDGVCMLTGRQIGMQTGEAAEFSDFSQLTAALRRQIDFFVGRLSVWDNLIDTGHARFAPLPFYSIATSNCIENGLDFNSGGALYNTTSPLGVGPITTGDSLAAIKKLVFDEKKLMMAELVKAMRENFQGMEQIRLLLKNRAPKFGNDDDYVDTLCNDVLVMFCDALRPYTNQRKGPFVAGLYYLSANIPFGKKTAATADGRRAGEPLNDGGVSPTHGCDIKGATAVARSVGKLDHRLVHHGSVLNQRFHPSLFQGEGKEKTFADFVRAFMDLGGWECQYNVVTTEQLREAQINPEKHRGLVVRVAGYSAFFTQLEPELQEDIIRRTEQRQL